MTMRESLDMPRERRRPSTATLVARLGLLLLVVSLRAAVAVAQTPAGEADPLTCWWRTSTGAIAVGQPFTLVLTCAQVDTESLATVVERNRLDPRAIELAPFEVLGGSVAADVKAGDWTFFQVEYRLRFVNQGFFDQDVALPPLAIAYRLETRGAPQGAATQGMERRFAMPHQTLRVTSLVPADATDIRDAAPVTFADLEARSARGRLLTTAGVALSVVGAGVALLGIARAFGGRRRSRPAAAAPLSDAAVVRHAVRALSAVRRRVDGAGRWEADDVADALAAIRIVGACAADGTPSQRLASTAEAAPSGALAVRRRWGAGARVIVSASETPKSLGAAVDAQRGGTARLRVLRDALAVLTAAQYADAGPLDAAALDGALDSSLGVAKRLALERTLRLDWLQRRRRRPDERVAR